MMLSSRAFASVPSESGSASLASAYFARLVMRAGHAPRSQRILSNVRMKHSSFASPDIPYNYDYVDFVCRKDARLLATVSPASRLPREDGDSTQFLQKASTPACMNTGDGGSICQKKNYWILASNRSAERRQAEPTISTTRSSRRYFSEFSSSAIRIPNGGCNNIIKELRDEDIHILRSRTTTRGFYSRSSSSSRYSQKRKDGSLDQDPSVYDGFLGQDREGPQHEDRNRKKSNTNVDTSLWSTISAILHPTTTTLSILGCAILFAGFPISGSCLLVAGVLRGTLAWLEHLGSGEAERLLQRVFPARLHHKIPLLLHRLHRERHAKVNFSGYDSLAPPYSFEARTLYREALHLLSKKQGELVPDFSVEVIDPPSSYLVCENPNITTLNLRFDYYGLRVAAQSRNYKHLNTTPENYGFDVRQDYQHLHTLYAWPGAAPSGDVPKHRYTLYPYNIQVSSLETHWDEIPLQFDDIR